MIRNFMFKSFNGQYLLTNDTGRYAFLPPDVFMQYIDGTLPEDSEYSKILEERYFLSHDSREVFIRKTENAIRDSKAYLFMPTSLFILAVTSTCNERCLYCQARADSANNMSIPVVRKIIERIAEAPAKRFTIEFQGGEPLTNFTAIKEAVRYAREVMPDCTINFVLVSNLSLMTEEAAQFIRDNRISVSTSLDGPKWLHDKNRPSADETSSYDAMMKGKNILSDLGLSVGAIQTTTRYSLPHADEIVAEYAKQGYHSLFVRPLTKLGAALEQWDTIGYTADEYLDFYRDILYEIFSVNQSGVYMSERYSSLLMHKMFGYPAQNYMELRSPCGAALGQMAFTASGDVYTCDEARMLGGKGNNTFRLGNVFTGGYSDWLDSVTCKAVMSASLLETLPSCHGCVYQPYCGVCPVVNYAVEGDLRTRSPENERCKIHKGILDILMELLMQGDPDTVHLLERWASEG